MIYDLLAPVYDAINKDVDYVRWADFIEKIISQNRGFQEENLILDLGCGTGKMTLELASRGYDMTGVDISSEMLDIARCEADERGLTNILWLNQDMREFELYGTVGVTVSCLDCMNHLTSTGDFKKCLSLVHNYLVPDGLFIFDINGKGKFEKIYADNSYVMENDGSMCIWQNFYNEKNKICNFYITLFAENSDGSYERYDEVQKEKMYTLRNVKQMLSACGFEFIGAYSDFEFAEARDENERIYIVAKCVKE
ncbi:MAG: class I SAM-dependent methyltransferase [Clostridia bacterium]|nr:class I SAM-dependent methyltransferase [Clostridia bacterium]